jgi:hypothetical protein
MSVPNTSPGLSLALPGGQPARLGRGGEPKGPSGPRGRGLGKKINYNMHLSGCIALVAYRILLWP